MHKGSTLAVGASVPVPPHGSRPRPWPQDGSFSPPDWTGRPVATLTQPAIQDDWKTPSLCQLGHPRLLCPLDRHARRPRSRHYVFTLEQGDSFPYTPVESYRFISTARCLSEGNLREGRPFCNGHFYASPGASPPLRLPNIFRRDLPSLSTLRYQAP